MYKLYYLPGASSLAIHVLLNELEQRAEFIPRADVPNYQSVNPTNKVPALVDGEEVYIEGAAIALHLLEKHKSPLLPGPSLERDHAIRWMMFANASMYTAYVKGFFAKGKIKDPEVREEALEAAVADMSALWQVAEDQLGKTRFLVGDKPSIGDIFLTVYAGWNKGFPRLALGRNSTRMVQEISSRPSFKKAIAEEKIDFVIKS